MAHSNPILSIIIPHFNQPDELSICLSALLEADIAEDLDVIVVDNGSRVFPSDIAALYPDVRFFLETAPGPGPARNLGVSQAESSNIAFIDSDCRPDQNWAKTILSTLSEQPGVLGGEVKIGLKDPKSPTIWEAYESEYGFRMDKYVAREGFSGAGNLAMPKHIFEHVGPFAGLGIAEDRDFGLRAKALGHATRYVPDMIVYHPARQSWAEVARKWDRQTGHQYAEHLTKPLGRAKWALRTLAMLVSPLIELPKIAVSNRIPGGVRGRLLCGAALIRVRLYRTGLMAQVLLTNDPDRLAKQWRKS
ncbi:MAG: glycosyltransferase [Deltaproteobacteria bacterium]